MRNTQSSDSDSAATPKPKAHSALQPQDTEAADKHAEQSAKQHSRKRHKPSKHGARNPSGAEKAAEIQAKATQRVQQLAGPADFDEVATSGAMAIAEKRQKDYNKHMQAKPWAQPGGAAVDSGSGVPALTGHQKPQSFAFRDAAEAWRLPGKHPAKAHEPRTDAQSPQGDRTASSGSQSSHSHGTASAAHFASNIVGCGEDHTGQSEALDEQSSQPSHSPPGMYNEIDDCHQHADSKAVQHGQGSRRRHVPSSPDRGQAVKDRQYEEQTQQHHPQNNVEDFDSLPPAVQKLQKAQQRAHDEMEAAEKQSNDLRFPAEAGQRFVGNARRHKSELDATVFEHGTHVRSKTQH